MIRWELNDGGAGWALGAIDGIVGEMKTNRYIDDITDDVADFAEKEIQKQIDALANMGHNIEHAYEFKRNDAFTPADRLWHTLRSGKGGRQAITWEFRPSVRGGPTIRERIQRGELAVKTSDKVFKPGKRSGRKVELDKREVFWNKAAMMEFGGQASVTPWNKKIFVPFRKGESWGDKPYAFLKGSSINLDGNRHQGAFSAAWLIASEEVGRLAEEFVETEFTKDIKKVDFRRARAMQTKSFAVAFADGADHARARLYSG